MCWGITQKPEDPTKCPPFGPGWISKLGGGLFHEHNPLNATHKYTQIQCTLTKFIDCWALSDVLVLFHFWNKTLLNVFNDYSIVVRTIRYLFDIVIWQIFESDPHKWSS